MPSYSQWPSFKGVPGIIRRPLEAVLKYCDNNFPIGPLVSEGPGGRMISSRESEYSTSASSHPFKVLRQNAGTEASPNWEWKVVLGSSLYDSLQPNDKQAITGLDTWFTAIGNDAIWLGVVFNSSGVITSATIDSWGTGDSFDLTAAAWAGSNGYCEDDGGGPAVHQTSRKLIAYSVAGSGGQPILTQSIFHDQVLRSVCIDGRPARYMFAHEGGYPL